MKYIKQAVMLAGGRGTRLRPLTDTMPKPMILFNGKPFLEYLIDNLREHGIREILLLLGYLPHIIQNYFGDGSKFGVHIKYSITDVENDTGRRMKLAEHLLDTLFLFMYCDNYWPLRLKDMVNNFLTSGVTGQLTVYSNKDKYTKPNVRIDENGLIVQYDKSRNAPHLQMVDIGFAIFKKEIMEILPDENVSFEGTVYPELVSKRQLTAYVTDHRYYSVSSYERLHVTREFLKREPVIILDRDGVLNKKAPKAEYIKKWDEFEWIDGAKEAILLLKRAGYKIIILTNQAGISRGEMNENDLEIIHKKMKEELLKSGGDFDAIYYCPHGWNDGCECRKPKPGMLFSAQRDFNLDLTRTFFIGDDVRDQQAGESAGCKTLLVSEEYPLLRIVKEKILVTEDREGKTKNGSIRRSL